MRVESLNIIQVSDRLLNGLERCDVFTLVAIPTDNGNISRSKRLICNNRTPSHHIVTQRNNGSISRSKRLI